MSREELQAYLQAQLEEIRRYREEQNVRCLREIDLKNAIEEWVEKHAEAFQQHWLSSRGSHPRCAPTV
jgi:hypothetical protein